MTSVTAPTLARKSVGGGSLWLFQVGASAPLTVIAGSVVATYASTNVIGVPVSFALLALALAPLTVGYVAMARYVPHPAIFYALMARGVGPAWGTAAGALALMSYSTIHLSLYGLFGATLSAISGFTWWLCAFLAWLIVALLGQLRVDINARFFAWALVAEIGVIVLHDIAGLMNPAGGSISFTPLMPTALFIDGVGGVLVLGIAAFVGYDSGPAYVEEARSPRSVAWATFFALGFLGIFYTVSSWAVAVESGPQNVAAAARADAELPLTMLSRHYGPLVFGLAIILLLSSILAAKLSFHNGVARYIFGMARDGVLPASLAKIGTGVGGGAPTRGSMLHSAVALLVLLVVGVLGVDPLAMFAWLAATSAIGVLVLLLGTAWASWRFFRDGGGTNEGPWVRRGAPVLGAIAGGAILAVTATNLGSLLGVAPTSRLPLILPSVVGIVAVGGGAWGALVKKTRPKAFGRIGRGEPDPLASPDQRLSGLEL